MQGIFISDLHLTERPEDHYRWEVFGQVAELSNKHKITNLFVLGDLTESKDYHSSRLVNMIVDSFYLLRKTSKINHVYFLKGNHDGIDPDTPYFNFMRRMPWAFFYTKPTHVRIEGEEDLLFLPHTRDPDTEWGGLEMQEMDYIFLHGTVTGAVAETGQKMQHGISLDWFTGCNATILAGDIHVPQKIGPVEYVGAPYPIRFGDEYQGRALVFKDGKRIECPLDNIRKLTLRLEGTTEKAAKDFAKKVREGDHVKFVIVLADSELGDWQEKKKWCADFCASKGALLEKTQLERIAAPVSKKPALKIKVRTPEESLRLFCKTNTVDATIAEVGLEILKENPA